MPPKKQRKSKAQNTIEKFLVKSTAIESEESNSNDDEELQQKIHDVKSEIRELLSEKRKLECLKLPKPYKLKDIPLNYDSTKFQDSSYGTHTAALKLKFHEFTGCAVSNITENELVVNFHVFAANQVHIYAIKLNIQDGNFTFSKCFVPPIIKINELLHQYPISSNPKSLINVIATACQVYHDIQVQIDQFKEKLDSKNVNIFNSFNNRLILLDFQMVQRSTESVFPVSVELHYDIYRPRPISISIQSEEMPRSSLKAFKKQCKNFSRFTLWNAFEIITNMGLKQHESVFYLLQEHSSEFITSVNKPSISKKDKSKIVIDQILRDLTYDSNDEDISVQKNESLDSSDESKAENKINSQSKKLSRKYIIKKNSKADVSGESSDDNLSKRNSKQTKVEIHERSSRSPHTNITKKNSEQSKIKVNDESTESFRQNMTKNNSQQSESEMSNESSKSSRENLTKKNSSQTKVEIHERSARSTRANITKKNSELSKIEVNDESTESSRKNITKNNSQQSESEMSNESSKSSRENLTKRNSKQTKVEVNELSTRSSRANMAEKNSEQSKSEVNVESAKLPRAKTTRQNAFDLGTMLENPSKGFKRSLEQSFTHAEINNKAKLRKIPLKDTSGENNKSDSSNSSVYSKETVENKTITPSQGLLNSPKNNAKTDRKMKKTKKIKMSKQKSKDQNIKQPVTRSQKQKYQNNLRNL